MAGGIVGKSAGLALLLGVEAEVLEQESLAGLEGRNFGLGLLAVGGELHGNAEALGHMVHDMPEGELVLNLLGASEVRHDDERSAACKNLLEGGDGRTDAGVIGDFKLVVERNVEIHTHNGLLAIEIVRVDVLLHSVILRFNHFKSYKVNIFS